MRKTLKKTTLPIIVFAILCIVSFALFFAIPTTRVAADGFGVMTGDGYKTSYSVNQEIDIVQGKITYEGTDYENIKGVVTTPSGKVVRVSSLILSEPGVYKVEYATTVNGSLGKKNVYYVVTFSVAESIYSFDTDLSSFTYDYDKSGYNMEGFVEGEENAKKGLTINIKSGDTFHYNQPINFNNLGASDRFITWTLLPMVQGAYDVLSFKVKLTDCYDPTNYIYINMATGYKSFGVDYEGVTYNGAYSSANSNGHSYSNGAGNYQTFYFNGKETAHELNQGHDYTHSKVWLGLTFDHGERILSTYNIGTSPSTVRAVSDFDDLAVYTNAWGGFTTGEAFLSIIPSDYMGASCRMFISQLAGLDDLAPVDIVDNGAPILTVDYGNFDPTNIPSAFVGCEYPIFPVSAFDIFSDCTIETLVYKDYYNEDLRTVVNFTGDSFVPQSSGLYTIVYKATDLMGNVSESYVNINCEAEKTIAISLDNTGKKACAVGETISVDGYEITGAFGTPSVLITATFGSETIVVKNGEFVPTQQGTYVVKYLVKDFSGQSIEVSYEVVTTIIDGPVLTPARNFEKYYIAGYKYNLPVVTAYDYKANQEIAVSTFVVENGVEREVTSGFVPVMTNDGTATVYYQAGDVKSPSYDIKIVNVKLASDDGIIDFSKYFILEDAKAAVKAKHVEFRSNEGVSSFSGEFVRPVLVRNFSIQFSTLTSNSTLGSINFTLTDAYDSNISISFGMKVVDGGLVYVYNGEETIVPIDNPLVSSQNNPYVFNYTDLDCYFTDNYKVKRTYTVDNNGNPFNGFPSGYAMLSFEVDGIGSIPAVLNILNINQQVFNATTTKDEVSPYIYTESYETRLNLNSIITLPDIIVYDVLDPQVQVTVSVTTLNLTNMRTEYVKDVTGRTLRDVPYSKEIKIQLSKFANYFISFIAKDSTAPAREKNIVIAVRDNIAPEITLEKNPSVSGSNIRIPKASAVDNIDGDVEVLVYVEDPNGWLNTLNPTTNKRIQLGDTMKVTLKGTYRVIFLARDAAGNFNYTIKTVTVK